jgi:hypothetical protein
MAHHQCADGRKALKWTLKKNELARCGTNSFHSEQDAVLGSCGCNNIPSGSMTGEEFIH